MGDAFEEHLQLQLDVLKGLLRTGQVGEAFAHVEGHALPYQTDATHTGTVVGFEAPVFQDRLAGVEVLAVVDVAHIQKVSMRWLGAYKVCDALLLVSSSSSSS
ncbi:hypothetical protein D3C81_1808970 [compost metagenome]